MGAESKEFLGSCDCCSDDGEVETITSYRTWSGDRAEVVHWSKNMRPARWCPQAEAFFVAGQDTPYRPTEPLYLMAS